VDVDSGSDRTNDSLDAGEHRRSVSREAKVRGSRRMISETNTDTDKPVRVDD
jgi:hypothetical protein